MKKASEKRGFYRELERKLAENKKLYGRTSVFHAMDNPLGRFIASYLGTNPWKVIIPASLLVSVFLRLVLGRQYSELVLRALGGR
jgi:hypothetical protein